MKQGLGLKLKKSIKLASANACKNCIPRENSNMLTHTEIHNLAKRAMPEDMCTYRHAIMLYKCAIQLFKLYNAIEHTYNWTLMNFNQILTSRPGLL